MGSKVAPLFAARKYRILTSLAAPESEYSDASPKGSVDTGIRELIDLVNGLEGAVTTSSCAGRISIFLEGRKSRFASTSSEAKSESSTKVEDLDDSQRPVPGGKGLGGRWLLVSHSPVLNDELSLNGLFGSGQCNCRDAFRDFDAPMCRLVRFAFEPMILHVMTASLQHARPILAAALDSGFRESGVQSLKSLDDPDAFPMVAIRTTGLSLSSIIGVVHAECESGPGSVHPLVNNSHLMFLLRLANERFNANSERISRLQGNVMQLQQPGCKTTWEDKAVRAERKRAEGLRLRTLRQSEGQQLSSASIPDQESDPNGSLVLPLPD